MSKGYAPAAKIVAVKVLNQNNAGQVSDWVAGFDWVYSNREMLSIDVINASLVSTAEYANATQCDSGETALAMITRKLIDAGVPITSSSGNTGHTATMTAPACNSGVIAVGATYDSDLGRQPERGGTYRSLGGSLWPACSDADHEYDDDRLLHLDRGRAARPARARLRRSGRQVSAPAPPSSAGPRRRRLEWPGSPR